MVTHTKDVQLAPWCGQSVYPPVGTEDVAEVHAEQTTVFSSLELFVCEDVIVRAEGWSDWIVCWVNWWFV